MMNGGSSRSSRFPFTPSQWQELEHQALIYKYMASGISIPPDLLFSIKRGYHLDHSRLFPHHHPPQHLGWNYLQMGLGRKIDPEPGRCRRTDGKKWRCSKEAYPDSKYCERHMHRGKNRSRKPVEQQQPLKQSPAAAPTNTDDAAASSHHAPSSSTTTTILSITNNNNNSLSPLSSASLSSHHDLYHQHQHQHSFLYHHQPSSRSSNSIGFSFQDNNNAAPLFLDTQTNTDCRERYIYGLKEEVDEHAFFTEPSGTMRSFSASSMDDSWQLTPLTISSSTSSKQRSCSGLSNENNNEYSYLQLHHHNNNNNSKQREAEQDHGCYMALGKEEEPHHQKTTVHRFFDEWPHKSRGGSSWLDLDDKSSTTQLSISIPTSSHDFTTFTSRNTRVGPTPWHVGESKTESKGQQCTLAKDEWGLHMDMDMVVKRVSIPIPISSAPPFFHLCFVNEVQVDLCLHDRDPMS
ncbi:hypothetical protein Ahy_Scaffold9g108596 [Arachis hypogaea]|uniref:Growth-regulating factor n=1 Tax=Arachis hypogaea TaxID=3818 RepID=A0A444WMY1_ARAHY|nr:hypothetical protein Ahy_Scaffold9g108596 [Arachis hypogaea]